MIELEIMADDVRGGFQLKINIHPVVKDFDLEALMELILNAIEGPEEIE